MTSPLTWGEHWQATLVVQAIGPDEYDEAVRSSPADCPLFLAGDRRTGRELLGRPKPARPPPPAPQPFATSDGGRGGVCVVRADEQPLRRPGGAHPGAITPQPSAVRFSGAANAWWDAPRDGAAALTSAATFATWNGSSVGLVSADPAGSRLAASCAGAGSMWWEASRGCAAAGPAASGIPAAAEADCSVAEAARAHPDSKGGAALRRLTAGFQELALRAGELAGGAAPSR